MQEAVLKIKEIGAPPEGFDTVKQEEQNEIIEALTAFFLDHGITSMKEFESLDEETGAELYEDLKAGILEVFDVDLDVVDELTEEILP